MTRKSVSLFGFGIDERSIPMSRMLEPLNTLNLTT